MKKQQISSKQEKVYSHQEAPSGSLYYRVYTEGGMVLLCAVGRTRYSGAFSEYVEHGWDVELTTHRPFGRRSARALARRLDRTMNPAEIWQGKCYGQLCQ